MVLTFEKHAGESARMMGRCYAANVPAARAFLAGIEGSLTLDCSRLEYISSAGLDALATTHERLAAQGGGLRLVGASRHLSDVLHLSGLDALIEVERAHGREPQPPAV